MRRTTAGNLRFPGSLRLPCAALAAATRLALTGVAGFLLAGATGASAQVLDFQGDAYAPGRTFIGADGWARLYKADSAVPAGNFLVAEEGANKLARIQTNFAGLVYREFPAAPVGLDLRWRWKANSDFVHMCMGASRYSSIDGFYPLALACVEPSGVMEAKGSQAVILADKWPARTWIHMRMLVDAAKNTFTLRMALDSNLADEKQILGPSPLNDAALSLSRVVIRMQNGSGAVDLDRIAWQPLTAFSGLPPAVLVPPRDTSVVEGAQAAFRVLLNTMAGSSFQWTRNGSDIPGATGSTHAFTAARTDSGAHYACRVSGAWGSLNAFPAKLRVSTAPIIPKPDTTKPDTVVVKPDTTKPDTVVVKPDTTKPDTVVVKPDTTKPDTVVIKPDTTKPDTVVVKPDTTKPDTVVVKPDTTKPDTVVAKPGAGGATVLQGGSSVTLPGGSTVMTQTGSPEATVQVLTPDSLKDWPGFKDILDVHRILPKVGSYFPEVEFTLPSGPRSLYHLSGTGPGAEVIHISSGGKALLDGPGIYFLALDTLAPRIAFLGESFTEGDSTRCRFLIEDNIGNPTLDLIRSDNPTLGYSGLTMAVRETLTVSLKNPGDGLMPLTLRLRASDYRNPATFPAGTLRPLLLSQRHNGPRRTPERFDMGHDTDSPWDLVAFPLGKEPPLTLAKLRKQNPGADLAAAEWDEEAGRYRRLGDDESLKAGTALWMASAKGALRSLALPSPRIDPQPKDGRHKVALRKGWNQVANPSLGTLYWPVSKAASARDPLAPVKTLKAYDPASGGYSTVDSLEPWRGYFVLNKGGDTTVTLLAEPPPAAAAAKRTRADEEPEAPALSMVFRLETATIRLGAARRAADGIGVEDEPLPPYPGKGAPRLAATRQSRSLETDIVSWHPGTLSRWRMVARLPAARTGGGRTSLESLDLPAGYAAWAVSRSRGVRVRLDQDPEASIPAFGGFTDSLEVVAGPAALVESHLSGIPAVVPSFQAGWEPVAGGFDLVLRLPGHSQVSWTLSTADGRIAADGSRGLPSGIYRLPIARRQEAGIRLLRVTWSMAEPGAAGGRVSGHWTRLIPIR